MATSPAFAATPRLASVSVATADSSYTAPTSVGTLITGAATGTKVNEIAVKIALSGLSTAAVIRIFLYDSNQYFLFDELVAGSATSSASVASTRASATYNNLVLPSSSWSVRVTTSVSQATHVTAQGADL
jgi:hypothetical protein